MDSKSNDRCPYERREVHIEEEKLQEGRGRDWSDAASSQGAPELTRGWRRPGVILLWNLPRARGPAHTLAFQLPTSAIVKE